MKVILSIFILCFVSSCSTYPWSYVGGGVSRMKIDGGGVDGKLCDVYLEKSGVSEFEEHLRNVLNVLGIKYVESGKGIRFACNKSEVVGFLAAISSDGTVGFDVMKNTITISKVGFPIEAKGLIIRGLE